MLYNENSQIDFNKFPESLRNARPANFSLCKSDYTKDGEIDLEPYLWVIIDDWMRSVTSELIRNLDPEKWEKYAYAFIKRIVINNDTFPNTLPIGYIIVSFLRTQYPTEYRLKIVKELFNHFLNENTNRQRLFDAYKKNQFIDVKTLSYKPAEMDGNEVAKNLYGSQPTLFDNKD